MAEFLSDEWFSKVDGIRKEHGDVPVPDALKNLQLNVVVQGHPDGDEKQVHMAGGTFDKGHVDGAPATLKIPFDIAKAMFIKGDQQAGMQAFMAGQIQVEGDMSVIMQIQAVPPSPEQIELGKKIAAVTA